MDLVWNVCVVFIIDWQFDFPLPLALSMQKTTNYTLNFRNYQKQFYYNKTSVYFYMKYLETD